jgi:hypothetical protein
MIKKLLFNASHDASFSNVKRVSLSTNPESRNRKIDKDIFIFLGVAVLILWQMLVPGYILTLDMVFTPETEVVVSEIGYNNSLPISYLIHFLNIIIPSWIIQKMLLVVLFFCLGYLPFKFLPLPENKTVRLFSALVYTFNPFVYSRFLAGHWFHLMAYALLPVFIYFLFKFTKLPSFKHSLKLFATISLISLFSIHFFTMVVIITIVWFSVYFIKYLIKKKFALLKLTLKNIIFSELLFIITSSYWLISAIFNDRFFENIFNNKHWQAFAASGYNGINTTLNVLSLNGYWGEGQPWAKQFLWPQDYLVFWFALIIIWFFILIAICISFKNRNFRSRITFFSILGILAFIFATGAGDTVFKNFNIYFYEHIPFWRGFRDSQKFSGLLALSYTVLSGIGLNFCLEWLNKKKLKGISYFNSSILIVPILFGFLLCRGFRGQLQAIWYPSTWYQAKNVIEADQSDFQVLFLPWHGYLSLNFNNNLLVANPAKRFFGEQAIVSKSIELKDIYDQQLNTSYIRLDKIINNDSNLTAKEAIDFLISQDIKYIVYFQDLSGVDNLNYDFLNSSQLKLIIQEESLIMYKIKND